ncbi:MAG: hypothetical protein HYX74_11600 [Acidobacteria bacterium]|nr:hypothetical protein [Acidobacteriota bacterium]
MDDRCWAWLPLLVAAALAVGGKCGPAGGGGPSGSGGRGEIPRPAQEERVASPAGDREAIVQVENGRRSIWVAAAGSGARRPISRLGEDEGARNLLWSPDGGLIAFESYNLQGHSPMTTTRVWVARADGGEVRRVDLPGPNERFSTYIAGWVTADSLKIRAELLRPEDVCYVYHFITRQMEEVPC